MDPQHITVPLSSKQIQQAYENNMAWQIIISDFIGDTNTHYPKS